MNRKYLIGLAAALLVLPSIILAQTNDLGELNVTSSRMEAPSIASSKPVTVISRASIEQSHAISVVDVLRGQANIVVRDTTGVSAKAQVDLGGFGETAAANSVVLIDGRRVNNPDLSGTDWTQIPLDQIERIEIVHGAGSVLYGHGAVGGVINIITKIPASGGDISLAGGSFGGLNGNARLGADAGRTRLEANISVQNTDGYRENNFFERFDGGARAEADLTDDLSLHISGNHHRDRSGLPGALSSAQVSANPKQAKNPRDFSRTSDSFMDGGLNWMSGFGLEADLVGGFRHRDVHSAFVSFASVSDFVQRNRSLRPKLSFTSGKQIQLQVVGGADIDRGDGSFTFSGAIGATEFKRQRDGYYGEVIVRDASGRWSINGGVRSEKISDTFTKGTVSSISNSEPAWEAGLSAGLPGGVRLRLNAARSIRFPLLDERFSFFTGTVDTTLKTQTGRHYSASLRYDMRNAWLELSASRASLDREIYYNPVAFRNTNYTNKTRHDVVLVSGHWYAHELLQLSANFTLSAATFRGGANDGKDIPAVARQRAGLNWQADWAPGLSSTVQASYVGSSVLISDQANTRGRLPSYLIVDAAVSYQWQDVEMFLRADNLTGKQYSNYGIFSAFSGDNFYPAPTANFRAGVVYHF